MEKTKQKDSISERISKTEKMCELISCVPEGRQGIISVAMLAYMNGMEAGMAYEHDTKAMA